MTYKLFFQDVFLGEVTETDSDFPTYAGNFVPSEVPCESALCRRLRAYLELTLQEAMNEDEAVDYSTFEDLIESEDWVLADTEGRRLHITSPAYGLDGELLWR
jgi:hypothetical protein